MSVSLHADDRRAVDLLLDRSQSTVGFSESTASSERVSGVEKILKMLDLMPAEEPPQDLLHRTLSRVGQSQDAALPAISAGMGSQQAHA